MTRLAHLRRLGLAALAAAGVAVACRAARPGEAPPLAPRPGPVQPANPVPGAPDPLSPATLATDARPATPTSVRDDEPITMREVPSPFYRAAAYPAQAPVDAAMPPDAATDAVVLPPAIPDAVPNDAAKTLQP